MKKLVSIVLMGLMLLTLLAGCGGEKTEKTILKVSHNGTTDSVNHECLVAFAEAVNEQCDDLEVEVYPNAELGNSADGVEAAARGSNICVVTDTSYLEDYVPDFAIMNGPFLYDDYNDIFTLADSDWHDEMIEASAEKGIRVLANNWYFGARYLVSDRVVKTPADMTGLKVRVPQNTMWIETLKAMGGNPTGLDLSEVYGAMSSGVIDAAEAPLGTIHSMRWHEVKKNLSATKHFTAFLGLYMSESLYDSLSPETQEILEKEAKKYGVMCSEKTAEMEEEYIRIMESEGAVFNDVDSQAFKEACAGVYTKFPQWTDGLYERVLSIID